jgi:hypothetical protein
MNALRSLVVLGDWASRRPGRSIKLEIVDGRFRATLADFIEVGGATAADALAQLAQIAVMENVDPAT